VIDVDPQGGLHLAYESSQPGSTTLRYKHRSANRGWDAVSTDLSYPGGLGGSRPLTLPTHDGNVTVAYVGAPNPLTRFMVKRRELVSNGTASVATPMRAARALALTVGPNPLRAGRTLQIRASSEAPSPMVDVFDIGGRIVAVVPLRRAAEAWRGELPGETSARWAAGIYFARLRSAPGQIARLVVLR
jgi:hypothetical protein